MENWRFIEENPDYMISDHGRVLSFKGRSKLILCAKIMGTGYETVILPNKGVCIEYKIHRLVAKAFIPNPEQLPQINHLDGNTMNNHVSNLEWCDAYTNMMHAIRTGLRRTGVGSHQTPFAVTVIVGLASVAPKAAAADNISITLTKIVIKTFFLIRRRTC